jgi:hypothetical protein
MCAGRRGAFLTFLTILDFSYGYALATASVRSLPRGPDLFLPMHVWGWVWVGAGVVCASGIFLRRDWLQYWFAAVLKACWAAVWADIWIVQHVPATWISIVIWAAFSLTVLLIGGWPEYVQPDSPPVIIVEPREGPK